MTGMRTRTVAILAFDDALLLDVTGPAQVFATANERSTASAGPPYRVRVVSPAGGAVETGAGLAIDTEPLSALARTPVDTLVIPGGQGVRALSRERAAVGWVRRRARSVRRCCSVCTGAFMLAAAGLLDGRRAATHWSACDELAARFPRVRLDRDAIFVRDQAIWTSAGVTAGIDLCLALVEEDLGREAAIGVARHLVVYFKRPGGQSQFSALLEAQSAAGGRFEALQAWIAENLAGDLGVERLAERAAMSPRHFARVYARETGMTPARFVSALRVEAARRELEEGRARIGAIAERTGFVDEERMRRAFVRRLGVSPRDYRRRFAAS